MYLLCDGIAEFVFDDILKEVFMVFFFTSVGFQANLKVLKSGGKSMIIFLGLVIGLIVPQNGTAVGLAKFLHLDPLVGMCTGSIPMTGGHGTAGAFGPVLEDFRDFRGNDGLYGGSDVWSGGRRVMGGPLGERLVEKRDLLKTAIPEDDSLLLEEDKNMNAM